MTSVAAAIRREQYELAALRLLIGLIETLEEQAPATRDQLVSLLAIENR